MKALTLAIFIFCCFIGGIVFLCPSRSDEQRPRRTSGTMILGRLGENRLSDFATGRSITALDALVENDLDKAVPVLESEVAAHPDALADYVGLLQAKPEIIDGEIARLTPEVAQDKPEVADNIRAFTKFKLAANLFYRWNLFNDKSKKADLSQSQELLSQAWEASRIPVIGMMLQEAARYPAAYGIGHPGLSQKTRERLLEVLMGEKAFAVHTKAMADKWSGQPPAVELVPVTNRRPLRGLVSLLWQISSRQGVRVTHEGGRNIGTLIPRTEDQQKQFEYYRTWKDNLTKILAQSAS